MQAKIDANVKKISNAMIGSLQKFWLKALRSKDPNELQGRTENNRVVNFHRQQRFGGNDRHHAHYRVLQLFTLRRVGLTELNHLDEESTLRNTPVPVCISSRAALIICAFAFVRPLDENLRQILRRLWI